MLAKNFGFSSPDIPSWEIDFTYVCLCQERTGQRREKIKIAPYLTLLRDPLLHLRSKGLGKRDTSEVRHGLMDTKGDRI